MSDITITKTAEDAASKALRVTVPVARVLEGETAPVRQYARRARLPGFRPGKAPEAVVRRRFSQEIRQWVIEKVIREGWEEAKSAQSLQPIADPSVRNLKLEPGQPVEFELLVEVRPEVALTRLGNFALTRTVAPVTEQMVEEQLGRLREQRAAWLPVEGAKPAPGQMVRVDVAPIEDGLVKPPQSYTLVLGGGQAIPELEDRILTLLPGETVDAEVRLPAAPPAPRRRVRQGSGRLRDPGCAPRRGPRGSRRRCRAGRRRRGPGATGPAAHRGQQRRRAALDGGPDAPRAAARLRDPAREGGGILRRVPAGRRAAGPAGAGAHRRGRARGTQGHRGGARPADRADRRAAAHRAGQGVRLAPGGEAPPRAGALDHRGEGVRLPPRS